MRRVLPLLLLLLLGACAERWTRPETTEAEADATNAACGNEAAQAVPEQLVWAVVEAGGYDRDRYCRHVNGREHCYYVTRWRPPRYGLVDANVQPREAWRRNCMREKGFTFEGYRPLRLQ